MNAAQQVAIDAPLPQKLTMKDFAPEWWRGIDADAIASVMRWEQWRSLGNPAANLKFTNFATLASPADTDNGQCWSEEIFSTL